MKIEYMTLPQNRSVILLAACLAFCKAAAFAGEDKVQQVPGFGQVVDPDGDCKLEASDGKLKITLPGTKVHDLSGVREENSRNAPRVLQEVEGNFTATVKVTCALEPARQEKNNSFNGAGLLVWESDKNFMRLERNLWVTPDGERVSYAPLFEYWHNNQCNTLKGGTTTPYFQGASTYLKITRAGDEFKTAVSHDGSKWMETDSVTATMPKKVKVGVAAINSAPNAFSVEFSDLKVDKGK
jgi:regulation of enolase protein 1 (concanavalin A-like superfamily)